MKFTFYYDGVRTTVEFSNETDYLKENSLVGMFELLKNIPYQIEEKEFVDPVFYHKYSKYTVTFDSSYDFDFYQAFVKRRYMHEYYGFNFVSK